MRLVYCYFIFLMAFFCSCKAGTIASASSQHAEDTLRYPEEKYFPNVQQLTFGGDNAEAYWSYDGKAIVFQRTSVKDGVACDQIFYGNVPERGRNVHIPDGEHG